MIVAKYLNSAIGIPLSEGVVQSFELDGEQVSTVVATYLRFGSWLRVVCADGSITIRDEEPMEFGEGEFKYPMHLIESRFPSFMKLVGKRLRAWRELVHAENARMSVGVSMTFEGGGCLIILNEPYPRDRTQYLFDGPIPDWVREVSHLAIK